MIGVPFVYLLSVIGWHKLIYSVTFGNEFEMLFIFYWHIFGNPVILLNSYIPVCTYHVILVERLLRESDAREIVKIQ